MARKLSEQQNTETPTSIYPFGRIKDDTGSNDGTPVSEATNGDFFQFFEKLMDASGISHNSLPDNKNNGFQLFDALQGSIEENTRREGGFINKLPDLNFSINMSGFGVLNDHIYVVEDSPENIKKFDLSGNLVQTFVIPAGVSNISDIRVDENNNFIYAITNGVLVDKGFIVYDEAGNYQAGMSNSSVFNLEGLFLELAIGKDFLWFVLTQTEADITTYKISKSTGAIIENKTFSRGVSKVFVTEIENRFICQAFSADAFYYYRYNENDDDETGNFFANLGVMRAFDSGSIFSSENGGIIKRIDPSSFDLIVHKDNIPKFPDNVFSVQQMVIYKNIMYMMMSDGSGGTAVISRVERKKL